MQVIADRPEALSAIRSDLLMNTRRASPRHGHFGCDWGRTTRTLVSLAGANPHGAVISNQALSTEQVSFAGKTTAWTRTAESGDVMTYHFCPICGSTLFWENEGFPGT